MANGLYGKAAPAAGVLTKITTSAPANGKVRTISVGVVNTTESYAAFSVAVSGGADAAAVVVADYKSYKRGLGPTDEYERTNIVISAGEHVYVQTDTAGLAFYVRGFEGNA